MWKLTSLPPGAVAPQVGLGRMKNAICVGQCLSLDLFKATNYTMQGCESVWCELGQSRRAELGNKEFCFFHLFPHAYYRAPTFWPLSAPTIYSLRPSCGLEVNSLNIMKNKNATQTLS